MFECPVCGHRYSTFAAGDFRCNMCNSHMVFEDGEFTVTLRNTEVFHLDDVEMASIVPLDDGTPSFGDGQQVIGLLLKNNDCRCMTWVVEEVFTKNIRDRFYIDIDVDNEREVSVAVPTSIITDGEMCYDRKVAAIAALALLVNGIEPTNFA